MKTSLISPKFKFLKIRLGKVIHPYLKGPWVAISFISKVDYVLCSLRQYRDQVQYNRLRKYYSKNSIYLIDWKSWSCQNLKDWNSFHEYIQLHAPYGQLVLQLKKIVKSFKGIFFQNLLLTIIMLCSFWSFNLKAFNKLFIT